MGKAGGRAMQNILNYMIQQYSEVIDLYTKARAAKIKFWHNTNDRFTKDWKKVFKLDKELHRLIKKTSNPRFVEKIFTGDISLKWLIR